MIGVDPDGNALKSVAYELKEKGYNVGIMTNNPVNHATPACFYANSKSRYSYYDICRQLAESGFDYFAGSGFYQFRGKDGDQPSVQGYIEEQGYTVCYGTEEFNARNKEAEKVIFIQESGREADPEYYVSDGEEECDIKISKMLEMGLEVLGDEEPFFIMCEGGEIDWAGHSNLTMPMIDAVIKFDDAIAVAYEFYKQHPEETLIVVTADHETGGLSIPSNKTDFTLAESGIGYAFGTSSHTATMVPVYLYGTGANLIEGVMENSELGQKVQELLGLNEQKKK